MHSEMLVCFDLSDIRFKDLLRVTETNAWHGNTIANKNRVVLLTCGILPVCTFERRQIAMSKV
jgi:hypothetical protein